MLKTIKIGFIVMALTALSVQATSNVHQHCKYHLKTLSTDIKQLRFNINRSAQQRDAGQYIIDLSQWPQQLTSWCTGEALTTLPFCSTNSGESSSQPIYKILSFNKDKLQVTQIIERQNDQVLRRHQIDYQPQHPRLKVKLQTTDGNNKPLTKRQLIAQSPISLVSFESILLHQLLQKPAFDSDDSLHWFEPAHSIPMKLSTTHNSNTYHAEQLDSTTGKRSTMFTITYATNGQPLAAESNLSKWRLELDRNDQEAK